jgi:hypothetical protein
MAIPVQMNYSKIKRVEFRNSGCFSEHHAGILLFLIFGARTLLERACPLSNSY